MKEHETRQDKVNAKKMKGPSPKISSKKYMLIENYGNAANDFKSL